MSNVRSFPIKYFPITKEAKELAEEYYGDSYLEPLSAIILSFIQLYNLPWTITQLISLTLKNKKLIVLYIEDEEPAVLNWYSFSTDLKEMAASHALSSFLLEEDFPHFDRELFIRYYKYLMEIEETDWWDLMEYVQFAYQVNFMESGIFELIKSMAEDGLLTDILGVDQWLKKTSIKLRQQWKKPPLKTPRPPIIQHGGQET
jgi:hypothetical protein